MERFDSGEGKENVACQPLLEVRTLLGLVRDLEAGRLKNSLQDGCLLPSPEAL